MRADSLRAALRTRTGKIAVGALQWVLLTATLGALIIYTDRSFEGLLDYHLQAGYAFFGAMVIGALLGATFESTRLLVALVLLACISAAGMYVAVLFTPVWTGTIVSTSGLENFASSRAVLHFGLAIVPTAIGAVFGQLVGPMFPGGDLLRDPSEQPREWWLSRRAAEEQRSRRSTESQTNR